MSLSLNRQEIAVLANCIISSRVGVTGWVTADVKSEIIILGKMAHSILAAVLILLQWQYSTSN